MTAMPTDFLPDDLDSVLQLVEHEENAWADVAAMHGNWGMWDDKRKVVLSVCALELRAGPPPKGATAWTDKLLDTAAHAHPKYKRLVDDAEIAAKQYRRLEARRIRMILKAKSLTYNPVR